MRASIERRTALRERRRKLVSRCEGHLRTSGPRVRDALPRSRLKTAGALRRVPKPKSRLGPKAAPRRRLGCSENGTRSSARPPSLRVQAARRCWPTVDPIRTQSPHRWREQSGPRACPQTGPIWNHESAGEGSPHPPRKSSPPQTKAQSPRSSRTSLSERWRRAPGTAVRGVGRAAVGSSRLICATPARSVRDFLHPIASATSCGFPLPGTMMPVSWVLRGRPRLRIRERLGRRSSRESSW